MVHRKGENEMNEIERMEFLLARMKDGRKFYSGCCKAKLTMEDSVVCGHPNLTINYLLYFDLSLPPLHSFTDDEKAIMRHLPYEWLVRTEDGDIKNYEKESVKTGGNFWFATGNEVYFTWLNHLFPTIQWENEEPVNRKDYL